MNYCSALINREIMGPLSSRERRHPLKRPSPIFLDQPPIKKANNTSEGDTLLNIRIPMENVIPTHALQSGHVVMGFTHCNRYILSYTIRPVISPVNENQPSGLQFDTDFLFTYKLYFWLFNPTGVTKKYSSVLLFDRNGVTDSNMLMQMCQWKYDDFDNDKLLVLVGSSASPKRHPRCYMTLTQLPPSSPCSKCFNIHAPEHTQVLQPCPTHSLTVSLNYELVSPYPKFDPGISLSISEKKTPTILINTGNLFHQFQFNPSQLAKHSKSNVLKTDLSQHHPDFRNFVNLMPHYDSKERRFFKRTVVTPSNRIQFVERKKPDIYDLFNEEDKIDKNYRLFRNRQLADKKYEFVDEYVLRPLKSCNKKTNPIKIASSKTIYIKKCTARVTRSYVLLNEDSVSTCTSIEDIDCNFQEYPVALPINVYTDQTQLSMIPNYKTVEKKFVVTQTTLDIEILSNEIANVICNKEGIRFLFLIDFDTVLLQTHPLTTTITAFVILLIQTATAKDENIRLNYETNYLVQWNPINHTSKIMFNGKLKIYNDKPDQVYNPTSELTQAIESTKVYKHMNPHLINTQMAFDYTSVSEIQDWKRIYSLFRSMPDNESDNNLWPLSESDSESGND